jgi:hypothetical protein
MREGLQPSTSPAGTARDARAQVRALSSHPVPESLPLDDLLATLATLSADAARAEVRLRERVALLRDRRATWAEIGAALGVTRQAAWERFGRRTRRAG